MPVSARFMSSSLATVVTVCLLLLAPSVQARGSGPDSGDRLIPYRGQLQRDGAPISSAGVPMTFTLSGGGNSWSFGPVPVDVYAGDFSLLIGDLALPGLSGAQTALPDWVFTMPEVAVSVEIDGVPLGGSQRIVPVPYAYWSGESDSFTVAGNVHLGNVGDRPGAQVYWNRSRGGGETNLVNHRGAGSGGFTFDDTADGASFQRLMTVAPTGDVHSSRDLVGGRNFLATSGMLDFGTQTRQLINLWGSSYGIGIQSNTVYQRSYSNFAWFKGGDHNNAAWNPGAGGTVQMSLDGNANLAVAGGVSAKGWSMPTGPHCVVKQRNHGCPAGYTQSRVRWDTEDSDNNDWWDGDAGKLSVSGGLIMYFCCN